MAYIDHASALAPLLGVSLPAPAPRHDIDDALDLGPAGFSPLEWTVVALAQTDRLSSLSEPSPLARAFGGLFGLGRQSSLADPALEALRRVAVHAWHKGYQLPVSEIKAFLAAGFSIGQYETLLASITTRRTLRRRRAAVA